MPTPLTPQELRIRNIGPAEHASPLHLSMQGATTNPRFVSDQARVAVDIEYDEGQTTALMGFEKAGPREKIFFEPGRVRAGIVTCGGLCPGTNNVVRSLVLELFHWYGVRQILGFRYGYAGIANPEREPPINMTPETVMHIHRLGGTVLGSSRGKEPVEKMADQLERLGVNMLFVIGGDGTLRGAKAIDDELARRGKPISVVAIPKTIDNDVAFVDKTFGFDTAVELARNAIDAAHSEATSAKNGIGLVKLMGRDSGFIAAAATLASREVNFCLVPEVPFKLDGERGLLASLERRLESRSHAVIVVAEGCAATLVPEGGVIDESGNRRYTAAETDAGPRLKELVEQHLKRRGTPFTLKYIDPSYIVRSLPANASDGVFCDALARNAVHAAMAGKSGMVIGRCHGVFTHVPIPVAVRERRRIDPTSPFWLAVLEATGQGSLVSDAAG